MANTPIIGEDQRVTHILPSLPLQMLLMLRCQGSSLHVHTEHGVAHVKECTDNKKDDGKNSPREGGSSLIAPLVLPSNSHHQCR